MQEIQIQIEREAEREMQTQKIIDFISSPQSNNNIRQSKTLIKIMEVEVQKQFKQVLILSN